MSRLLDALANAASPWGYVFVGLLATLEAAAFVGLVIPGETALIIGGFLAYQGKANVYVMMGVAAAGAVVGDSIGYEIGRVFGPSLRSSRLGRKVGEERWQRAEDYLDRRGGRAIFFGRFIGVLRALVPTVAGLTRMRYRTFLGWNAAGGIIWAPSFVVLGYVGGSSYKRVERIAGRAALVLVVLVLIVALVILAARAALARQDRLVAMARRFGARPPVARLRSRFHRELGFLAARFRPGAALGFSLTAGLVFFVVLAWAFGALLTDVLGRDELATLDGPIRRFFASREEAFLTTPLRASIRLWSLPLLAGVALLPAAWPRMRVRPGTTILIVALCVAGASGISGFVRELVDRPSPRSMSASFPSVMVAAVAATMIIGARYAGMTTSWRRRVVLAAIVVVTVVFTAFVELYLARAWFTDVVGGAVLGSLWVAVVLVTAQTLGYLKEGDRSRDPSQRRPGLPLRRRGVRHPVSPPFRG